MPETTSSELEQAVDAVRTPTRHGTALVSLLANASSSSEQDDDGTVEGRERDREQGICGHAPSP